MRQVDRQYPGLGIPRQVPRLEVLCLYTALPAASMGGVSQLQIHSSESEETESIFTKWPNK